MTKRRYILYVMFAIILILGIIARLYRIDNPVADWHSFRQADTASVSKIYVTEGVDFFYPKYHDISTTQSGLFNPNGYRYVEVPIFNSLHSSMSKVLPNVDFDSLGRMLSLICAAVSSVLIFFIAKRIFSESLGLISAGLYLLLPFNIFFTRLILPEPFAVLMGLAGLYCFLVYHENESSLSLLISSTFFSLGLLVKPYIVFYGVPVIVLIWQRDGFEKVFKDKKLILAAAVVVTPLLYWRWWIAKFPEGVPFWKWTFNGDGIRFRPAFWKWILGERLTKLILGYWGLIPFGFGLIAYERKSKLFHAFLLGMFLYVSVIATANVRHDYYQTIVVPAVVLITGLGVDYMWNRFSENKRLVRGLCVVSLGVALVSSASEVKEFYRINNPEIINAGVAMEMVSEKEDLVIAPYNGDTAFLYQTERSGWPVVDRPIDELIEKGAKYFVSVDLAHYQTVEFSQKFKVVEKTDTYVIIDLTKSKS